MMVEKYWINRGDTDSFYEDTAKEILLSTYVYGHELGVLAACIDRCIGYRKGTSGQTWCIIIA
jgi:hypothetical protein